MREKPASPPRVNIHGDVPADRPSTARDATGLPASGSHLVHGKRSLPVPNKVGQPAAAGLWPVSEGNKVATVCAWDVSFY